MSDKTVIKGISKIINPQNTQSGVKYDEIEREMLNAGVIDRPKDPAESFKAEMNNLAKNLNLNFETPKKTPAKPPQQPAPQREAPRTPPSKPTYDRPFDSTPYKTPSRTPPQQNRDDSDDEKSSSESESDEEATPQRSSPPRASPRPPSYSYDGPPRYNAPSSPPPRASAGRSPGNTEFGRRTREQERHAQIRSVMQEDMGGGDEEIFTVEKEKMEDMKTSMLVEIDSLWAALEEDSVDLSRVPRPGQKDTYETIENVLKTLRMKLDRARYCSLADEVVLALAGVVEDVFNGKNVFLGRYSPDMTGWSKSVGVKLRRMKHDTSTIVSNAMNEYNVGPGTRIFLELIPNAFVHARSNRNQFGKETLYSDPDLQKSIRNIRDIDGA